LREIEARDERDANRKVAPLKPASGALIVDTTGLPVGDVVRKVLALVRTGN
jgi:cytidylate kinase